MDDVAGKIEALARQAGDPRSSFGIEHLYAHVALRTLSPLAPLDGLGTSQSRLPYRLLLARPAIEPPASHVWAATKDRGPLTPELISAFAIGIAAGDPVVPARSQMRLAPRRGQVDVLFEEPARAATWLPDVNAAETQGGHALDWPIYTYARVLLGHPLSDGNGRLARFLLQLTLMNRLGLSAPHLGFAAFVYANAQGHNAAHIALSATRT